MALKALRDLSTSQAMVEGSFYLLHLARRTGPCQSRRAIGSFHGRLVDILRSGSDEGPDYITLDEAFQQVRDRLVARPGSAGPLLGGAILGNGPGPGSRPRAGDALQSVAIGWAGQWRAP
ncbi:hypothetical protein GCM10010215_67420 [Streptomyces virginiae]|uniref:Uncharacterized protein n=1 Tax=Streptomyces virginiae TaxID=1961 RepID=A0ABQ3NMU5_STRVG|nr:hypothetical protein GCM10010215_67420 [Streptomyces virginiae]GHI14096.1 hypothetical protein Scinn_35590 [Streptomyces virginiae]